MKVATPFICECAAHLLQAPGNEGAQDKAEWATYMLDSEFSAAGADFSAANAGKGA
jgi:hypothetical protein